MAQDAPHDGRRPDPLGHADPADLAHEPAGHPRHLEPGDPAARPQGDRDADHPLRRRDDQAGHPPRAEPRRPDLLRPQPGLRHRRASPTGSSRSSPRPGSRIGHGQMGGEAARADDARRSSAASTTSWSRRRSSRAAWTSPTSTRSSSTRPTSTAWPTCTSFAAGSAATSTGPMRTCCSNRTSRSRPTPSSGSRRSRSSPSWAPASRSPCATWRSAAPGNILGRRAVGPHRERRLRALLLAAGIGRARR